MKKSLFIITILVLLLIPCGAAYAYDGVGAGESPMTIEPADPALTPNIEVFGNAIGGVEAGDLFYIDVSGTTVDTPFTLYITNVDELVHGYRYMNLNVGIYVQTGTGNWEKLSVTACPEMYLTMQNGLVNFTLPGSAKYKVTIENGCYRSYYITPGSSIAIPSFYLTAS
ncbi:MAG: hypothetical protein JW845_02935 [Dehalococcoidales bacterium]|nr:hypothetical protein [Dehalococcoidales bacterium]